MERKKRICRECARAFLPFVKETHAHAQQKENTRTKGLGGFMIVAHASLMDIPLAFARVSRFAFSGWCAKICVIDARRRKERPSSTKSVSEGAHASHWRDETITESRVQKKNALRPKPPRKNRDANVETRVWKRKTSVDRRTQTFPSAPFRESKSTE